MNLIPEYKRTVDTPKGRGIFIKQYTTLTGHRMITVRFYPPQFIKNGKGKTMKNPNAGNYMDKSFHYGLCIIQKRRPWFVDLYKKLVACFNKIH